MLRQLQPDSNRGQTYTFEGIMATLMIIGAVIFALQATAVTPLTASTANQQVETQNQFLASDVLDTAHQQQTLESTLLYYNSTADAFVGADDQLGYYTGPPPTRFGALLGTVFETRNAAYNVYIRYTSQNGNVLTQPLVYQGKPSNNAASGTTTVVLHDDMQITHPSNNQTIKQDTGFYIPDAASGSNVYNVVEIKIVVWKI